MKKILGVAMMVLLFGGLFAFIGLTGGWFWALVVFGAVIFIMGWLALAAYLMSR